MAWDDEALYVAFECEDPDVWGTFRKRDEPLYTQEAVEIFLDADADGRTYDEIEVSPHNVVFDAYFPARRQGMDLSWDSGLQSAVKVPGTLDDASRPRPGLDGGDAHSLRAAARGAARAAAPGRSLAVQPLPARAARTGRTPRGRPSRRCSSATSTRWTGSPGSSSTALSPPPPVSRS